ncbi:hypothetical protein BU16DRAFT_302086 [Lophium mytilinum]|uniref:P-loop containing nucleoside triphosphate hydrolase protein n=1 Tax=Lophium mytilinum TaxID=390894 RepID=A0A6A6R4I6_9PEZI|nr:hypothetical protein BU16DRAFT_302086 [Lophium mytilinum]
MSVPSSKWSSETTLNQLHSPDESQLLDVIDQLRSQGVGRLLGEDGLPQLIVCGDQSSGKSSVLEALTRVRFPTRSNLCTTFATELKLRRSTTTRISTKIKPGPSRSDEDKQRLSQFKESFQSPDHFPQLIETARACMKGIDHEKSETFFDDILQVEINGPDLAPLTIVDLPGIIHFRNNEQEVQIVSNIVRKYMKQRNSIILAVVAANNDYSNQVILTYTKAIVPQGDRVLGIITKPDTLHPESKKEQDFLSLARNTEIKFEHGWHVVRNWDSDTQSCTFEQRDQAEHDFFENGSWANLPTQYTGLGIDSLRQRLSKILLDHIRKSMPSILAKLNEDRDESEGLLKRLGKSRETPKEQHDFLSDVSETFTEHMRDALDATYRRSSFFQEKHRKLRAVVQNLNEEFANEMLLQGQKWYIIPDNLTNDPAPIVKLLQGKAYRRSNFIQEIVVPLVRSERGHELPGAFNHLLIGSLFRQQIEPWEDLASAHIERVWVTINRFVEELLDHITDETTSNNLLVHVFDPAMKVRRRAVEKNLQELLLPHKDYEPMNLDPSFSIGIPGVESENSGDGTSNSTTRDSSNSHEKLLDAMQSYYKPAMMIFMNNVASLGIEQCLLAELPKVFSSSVARNMNVEILASIATESRATIEQRARLRKRLELLETGLETIKQFTPRGMHDHGASRSTQTKSQLRELLPTIFSTSPAGSKAQDKSVEPPLGAGTPSRSQSPFSSTASVDLFGFSKETTIQTRSEQNQTSSSRTPTKHSPQPSIGLSTTGGFGASTAIKTGNSLFGSNPSSFSLPDTSGPAQKTTSSTSGFGDMKIPLSMLGSSFSNASKSTTSGFGGSLFGSTKTSQTAPSSLFGASGSTNNTTPSGFGGSLFDSTKTGQTPSSLFGTPGSTNSTTTSGFSGSLFSSTETSQTAPGSLFGTSGSTNNTTTSGGHSPQPKLVGSLFGAGNTKGSDSPSVQSKPGGGFFGASSTTASGSNSAQPKSGGGLFGARSKSGEFGFGPNATAK